jgi:hypothetical protein
VVHVIDTCSQLITTPWRRIGSWGIAPRNINPVTSWRWVACTHRPLYPTANSPRCPLDRGLGGPWSLSGRFAWEKNLLTLLGIEPWLLRCSACGLVTILAKLSRPPAMASSSWKDFAWSFTVINKRDMYRCCPDVAEWPWDGWTGATWRCIRVEGTSWRETNLWYVPRPSCLSLCRSPGVAAPPGNPRNSWAPSAVPNLVPVLRDVWNASLSFPGLENKAVVASGRTSTLQLTPWSTILLYKLTIVQLVKRLAVNCATWRPFHWTLTRPFEPAHTLTPLFLKVCVNVIPSLASKSRKQFLQLFWLRLCYISRTSHSSWLDHPNTFLIQIMKLLFMLLPPVSCHFVALSSQHTPQHPVLRDPQPVFFLWDGSLRTPENRIPTLFCQYRLT